MKDEKKDKKDKKDFPFFMKKKKGKKDKKENKEETKEKNESFEDRRLQAIIETVNRIVAESAITEAIIEKPKPSDIKKIQQKKQWTMMNNGQKKGNESPYPKYQPKKNDFVRIKNK